MITLRRFTIEDAPSLQERYSNFSREQIEEMICKWNSGQFDGRYFEMLAIISDGSIVGTISLYEHSSKVVSIGPEVFEPYRKNGYGKEAMLKAFKIAADREYKVVSQQIRTDNSARATLTRWPPSSMTSTCSNSAASSLTTYMTSRLTSP